MHQIPQGSVLITPTQMYEEIRATHHIALEIRSALDPMRDRVMEHESRFTDHETRIRAMERRMWAAAGIAAALGAGAVKALSAIGL